MKKMIALLALIALAVLATSAELDIRHKILEPFLKAPTKELFKAYHQVFKKNYDLNTEEGIRKYRAFKQNLKYIKEENSKGHSYTLGIGPFTDMTLEEFKRDVLMPPTTMEDEDYHSDTFINESFTHIPGSVNVTWVDNFGPVKDQGGCGSCWDFAAVGAIEGNYFNMYGKKISLSEQQVLDCNYIGFGCNGGTSLAAMTSAMAYGVETEQNYPYTAVKGKCRNNAQTALKIVSNFVHIKRPFENWLSYIKRGPMAVSIDGMAMMSYQSGIFDGECLNSNHGVVAVGFQPDEGGDLVVIRNSWGSGWGEGGYARIRFNPKIENACLATGKGVFPILRRP